MKRAFGKASLTTRAMFAAALLALPLVGCGNDDSTSPTPTNPTPGATSIVDVAAGDPQFSTLVAAVTKAGLADTLKSAGPFTVFAPNNKAFVDSGITSLDGLSASDLKTILLYHVVGAKVMAADVKAGPVGSAADLTFFLGTSAGVQINGGNSIKGGANVIATDVKASNGVIHVIDRVMLPPDIAGAASYGGLTELTKAIVAAAEIEPGTSVLKALQGAGPFTVFAPSDAAFKAIAAPSDAKVLRDVLLLHVVKGGVTSDKLPMAPVDSLLAGEQLSFNTMIPAVSSKGTKEAKIVAADIRVTNGVIHLIDKVLLP